MCCCTRASCLVLDGKGDLYKRPSSHLLPPDVYLQLGLLLDLGQTARCQGLSANLVAITGKLQSGPSCAKCCL